MKIIKIILITIAIVLLSLGVRFYIQNLRGVWPIIETPSVAITKLNDPIINKNLNLKLPDGFTISILDKDIPGARVMVFDNLGNIWVSQTGQGKISKIILKNGEVQSQEVIWGGLKKPHGLVFDPENPNILYIAEETKISKVSVYPTIGKFEKVIDLPKGGRHFTRTLGFGPDKRLYVSIGSTCDTCNEPDPRNASIYSLNKDGSDFKQLAKGLRNSVFFTWNKKDGKMWATEMGHDYLGDNTPPDEINTFDIKSPIVLNYGWPICYGNNIHDTNFDKNTYIRNPCMMPFEIPSYFDIQAHSAPLGLDFIPDNYYSWPKEYQHNLIVAFHGSWNRTVPTGYKLVRFILDDKEKILKQEDFITGWLTPNGAIGRPVDIVFNNNALYITDDKAGTIYKVVYTK